MDGKRVIIHVQIVEAAKKEKMKREREKKEKEIQKQKWPATSRGGDRMILQYQYICARYVKAATQPQQAQRTPEKINCRIFFLFFFLCVLNMPTVCAVDFTPRG